MSDDVALSLWPNEGLRVAARPAVESSAYGKIAELRAIDELIRRGHKVAIPVVDDDGVDLVVDYRTTVQVKTSHRRLMETAPGYSYGAFSWGSGRNREFRADIYLLHAAGATGDRWWVVPADVLRGRCAGQINMYLESKRGLSATLREFEDRWDLLA